MSTSTTEPTTTTSPSTESKPQPAPAPPLLSYAARAAKSLPPPSADLPTPISTPGKSINAPSTTPAANNQPTSSSSANKGSKSSRASRSSRPERSAAHPSSSSGKNPSTGGRNPSSRKHGGGGENKSRGGGNKEGGAGSSSKTPAVEGASVVDGEGAASTPVADDTPAVPPPAPKPAPLPLVNIWKTRADAVKPNEKEGGHKSNKSHKSHHNHANKSTSTTTTTPAHADASARSTDPSHPSFPSLADAPASSTKRSSSANPQRPATTSTLPNGESWPEPSPASIALARAGNASAEDEASAAGSVGGKAGKKEKTKWVAISPIELQLSVDLASDRSKKSRPRRIPSEDASAVPPPRVNNKKKASTSGAAPNTTAATTTPSTSSAPAPSKKSTSSKKNDPTPDIRLPGHGSTSATAPSGEAGGKKVVFGSVEGGETDPLVSMAASMPSPSRQLHGLPPLAGVGGVSLGIEGMMRKDEEVVEVSSEVERSLLRSAADARSTNASLFSPPSPDILPFDLQPAPHFSNSPSANGHASLNSPSSSSAKASDLAPQEDASSKPLHTPAPKIAVRITAPGPNYVNGKAPTSSSSAARGGRGGAQPSRGGLPGGRGGSSSRGGAIGGGPSASSFTNRNNPFAAPFYQMQQQQASHNGGPLPINGTGGAPYLTSPLPSSNGILATPPRNAFSPPLSSPYSGGPFPPSFHPHHQPQHASFPSVPLVRGPSQTSAASSTTTTNNLPPPAPAPTSITHHPNGNPNTSFPHHYAHAPPPMPMPVTVPSFPLDPLRFYLLGQLEYYFGVQNLAMDFFLRQQMDTLGFVSIPLIATFNRVKNLTSDLTIVREMMALSSIFEVRGDKVRLSHRGWEQWTLPGAGKSEEVEEEEVVGGEEKKEVVAGEESKVGEVVGEKKVEEEEKRGEGEEEELTQDEKDEREVEEATLSI